MCQLGGRKFDNCCPEQVHTCFMYSTFVWGGKDRFDGDAARGGNEGGDCVKSEPQIGGGFKAQPDSLLNTA